MAKRNRIYLLCGFMGSGKTTLLQKIASWGVQTYDLDDFVLEKTQGHDSLGEYIRSVGWEEFRDLEESSLKALVDEASCENTVVALGGGTLDRQSAREYIKSQKNVQLVWLHLSFEECMSRIQGDANRPQLDKSIEDLQQLFAARVAYFEQADVRLEPSDVEKIKNWSDFEHKLD